MYRIFTIAILLFAARFAAANTPDEPWALSSNKDGIKVYTRHIADSKIKAIKVECTLNATPAQLVAVLMDIKTCGEWVYHTKSATVIKTVSPSDIYYYSEVNIPWPVHNRDFIAHLKVTQDAKTKVVTIDAPVVSDMMPVKDGIVRVEHSTGRWVITPVDSSHVSIVYTLHLDPGGSVPAWLINMFAAQGPTESFIGLKKQLLKPAYKDVKLSYIQD
ncbi:START domain-containing protein [Mucilaginibacter celer]|uniref:Lipid-binding protein n=1 Tax=Mucilaginibacter celer TaxID=2305508 RepID=A0A494W0B3_9SPHI|nr:START domain-containing protein [Mucilaginibacter celer]AYL96905.1 lipid-binding protein [Mucilaginibacter celer]